MANQINVINWSADWSRSLVHALSREYAFDGSRTVQAEPRADESVKRKEKKREKVQEEVNRGGERHLGDAEKFTRDLAANALS